MTFVEIFPFRAANFQTWVCTLTDSHKPVLHDELDNGTVAVEARDEAHVDGSVGLCVQRDSRDNRRVRQLYKTDSRLSASLQIGFSCPCNFWENVNTSSFLTHK